MKVGILSDIHGNHYALLKVLEVAAKENVEELLILGDFVGYYYYPDKVLKLLEDWKFHAIQGNHEQILADLMSGTQSMESVTRKYGTGHEYALTQLSDSQKELLINLPIKLEIQVGAIKLLMTHGSPWDKDFYVYPDATGEVLAQCDFEGVDFVLAGHTHYAFSYRNEHSTFLNPGSVGQSRNQSGLAQWALINADNRTFEMRSTRYDASQLIKDVQRVDPGNYFLKDVLTRNA